MAAVPVSMNVVIYPMDKRAGSQPYKATIVGSAWLTGLAVGGGPTPGGPGDAHPEHPIVLPPVETPPDPDKFPNISAILKSAPPGGGWQFTADNGWQYDPGTSGAGPKR